MGLKIRIKKHGRTPVLLLGGKAVGEYVRRISEKISDLAEGDSQTIVIDLSALDCADSNGLGAFVYSWKLVRSKDKKLLFLDPLGLVKNLFEESGLDKVFTIIASLDGV